MAHPMASTAIPAAMHGSQHPPACPFEKITRWMTKKLKNAVKSRKIGILQRSKHHRDRLEE
jgi:hypothetical protein